MRIEAPAMRTEPERGTGEAGPYCCRVCGYETRRARPQDVGEAPGNTERFAPKTFRLWQCPACRTIRSLDPVDFAAVYADYPLKQRKLDFFARRTLGNLLRRLRSAGLKKTDRILDYGCGNGVFVAYLREKGYADVSGFDPYEARYAAEPPADATFDCVIVNDVIEHCDDPREILRKCGVLLRDGGLLYVGTSDAAGVAMDRLEPHLMRLHLPFHRTIMLEEKLHDLVLETGFLRARSWRRSYMDTLVPFANYRFLDEFNKALGHIIDRAFAAPDPLLFVKHPRLLFFGFFGYFLPSACEPAIAAIKSTTDGELHSAGNGPRSGRSGQMRS